MTNFESQFRVAEIEVNKSTLDEKILGIFRYDSDSRTKSSHTTVVILAEIGSALYTYEQLLDTINETAEQATRMTSGLESNPIARFEKFTQTLNEAVAAFVKREATPLSWNRVNIFVLQLSDGHLCFSGIGQMVNLFLQKQKDGSYRTFDLFGSLDQQPEINPEKPFASLICGDIKPGDTLFAGSLNFQRVQQDLDLEEKLQTLPPVTAALEIKQLLENNNIPDDFAAVIIAGVQLAQQTPQTSNKPEAPPKPKSTESVEKMRQSEELAEAMLSPIITPLSSAKAETDELPEMPAGIKERLDEIGGIMEKPRPYSKASDKPLAPTSLRSMHVAHGTFFSRKRKLQLAALLVAVIALVAFGLWYRAQRQFANEQTLWNAVYDQATDRKTRAEADIVIGNEEHARGLIKEAEGLVAGLDSKTADRKKAKDGLSHDLEELTTKLKRITVIEKPEILFELPATSTGQLINVALFYQNNLYLTTPADSGIIQFDPATKATRFLAAASGTNFVLGAASKEAAVLYSVNRNLYAIDATKSEIKKVSWATAKASSTQALAIYGKRLYALDQLNGMIWKYAKGASGYEQEAGYLKQNTHDLNQARGLAIDSNVYLAFSNGLVVRYLAGAEEAWALQPMDPPLQSLDGIWTSPDSDRLVLLDIVGKRVLVMRKDGSLVAQITSPEIKSPQTVTADEVAKKIYLADGGRLLVFDLP